MRACTHARVRMRAHVCVRARVHRLAWTLERQRGSECHSAAAPCQRRSGRERRRVEPTAAARVPMHDALLRRACAVDVPSLRAGKRVAVCVCLRACGRRTQSGRGGSVRGAACCLLQRGRRWGARCNAIWDCGERVTGEGTMGMHARTHRPRDAASQYRGGPGVRACLSTNTSASIAPSVCGCTRPTSASHARIASMHIASACKLT